VHFAVLRTLPLSGSLNRRICGFGYAQILASQELLITAKRYIQFAPELENGSVLKIYCLNLDDKIGYFSENCSCSIPVNLARRFNVDLLGVEL